MSQDYQKVFNLSVYDKEKALVIFKALSNETRINILKLLTKNGPLSIQNIAFNLNQPLSTISEHIQILLKTGLISVIKEDNDRGKSKIVCYQYEHLTLDFVDHVHSKEHIKNETIEVPIGSYSSFDINNLCGMISPDGYIGERDNKNCFYESQRHKACLIWFDYGYLEYSIPIRKSLNNMITSISISFEICSEAPGYNDDWKSDIYFCVNGNEIGEYTSPGDYGKRKGKFNLKWWTNCTSYGMLKSLEIKSSGSYLDGEKISDITINDLHLNKNNLLVFRLGVKKDAKNRGGINIFGENFGDYSQPILVTISHK